jgi:hypothetical protein
MAPQAKNYPASGRIRAVERLGSSLLQLAVPIAIGKTAAAATYCGKAV